jgi:regulator of sirC expression with transglutaminase-like and TPR domain
MTEIDDTTFAEEVQAAGDALSPGLAGLLFARECAYPDLRPSDYVNLADDLALNAQRRLAAHSDGTRGLALAEHLFGEAGFRGNAADYDDPRNSYLNQVFDRRLGIPISLSVVLLEVSRRLGIRTAGIGLPGHFIAVVEGEDGPIYVDPFDGARVLTRADCAGLVQAATGVSGVFDADWLRPAAPREVVERMLRNLRNFYVSVNDWPLAIRVVDRLRELQTDVTTHVRDLGVLYYRDGSFRRAYELLNEYLRREPYAADAAGVREGRDRLALELARCN